MAEMMTPEEIQEAFRRYNEELANTGRVSKETAEAFKDAQKGVKNYTYQLNQSLNTLKRSIVNMAGSIKDGASGASVFNSTIESAADVVDNFASKFGVLGKVLGFVAKAGSKYVSEVNKQADSLYKTFQDISRTGTMGAGGMREVFDNMQKFGYGIAELDKMTALLRENSQALASFGGTAFDGARQMANLSASIKNTNLERQLRNMGMNVDDINAGIAGYIKMQTFLGRGQAQQMGDVREATVKYIRELDALSRLTGDTREAQQAKIDEAMAEETFAATMDELQRAADAGDAAAAAQLQKLNTLNQTLTGEARREFLKAVGGDIGAAQKLLVTAPQALNDIFDTSKTAADVMNSLAQGERQTRATMGGLAKIGAYGDTFLNYSEGLRRSAQYNGENAQALMDSSRAAQEQTDQTTKNMTDMQIEQRNARDALQSLINAGIKPVTSAMSGLAKVINKVAQVPGTVAPGVAPIGGGGAGGAGPRGGAGGGGSANLSSIREMISGVESRGNYNVLVGGQQAPLTGMTIQQVLSLQQELINQGQNSAAGKYQIKRSTLMGLVNKLGLDPNAKFDQATQDRLADELIKGRGYAAYAGGQLSKEQFLRNLSMEWAGLPSGPNGQSYYAGVGNNKAGIGWQQAMQSFDLGGIARGPNSGYQATLHGTEAVVPLPDGRTIPVEMRGFSDTMEKQVNLMSAQLGRLDELLSVMRDQASTSRKILNYTQ